MNSQLAIGLGVTHTGISSIRLVSFYLTSREIESHAVYLQHARDRCASAEAVNGAIIEPLVNSMYYEYGERASVFLTPPYMMWRSGGVTGLS